MQKKQIRIMLRTFKNRRTFTIINILGLALGMASAMLIMLWLNFQLAFDRCYPRSEVIYAVGSREPTDNGIEVWFSTPEPLAQAVKNDIPGIKQTTRLTNTGGFLFQINDRKIVGKKDAFVDSSFLVMFGLPLLAGDPKTALVEPTSIVLTKNFALTLFGSTTVVGKRLRIGDRNDLVVSAVLDEIPENSRFAEIEYFLPWTFMEKLKRSNNRWDNSSVQLLIELLPDARFDFIQDKIKGITKKYADLKTENFIVPINRAYLYNEYSNGVAIGGRITMVRAGASIAVLILLTACFNFMNLSTAQSEKRAKEISIRKTIGAGRATLIKYFIAESIILSMISGFLALFLVYLLLPRFAHLVGQQLSLPFLNPQFWLLWIVFTLLTGILAGTYPAFFLSSFQPRNMTKYRSIHRAGKLSLRKILVVAQFAIAVILIISTLVVHRQLQHGQNREAGFHGDHVIYISENEEIKKNSELIKHDLLDNNIALAVCRTMSPLTENWSTWNGFGWEGKDPNAVISFNRQSADESIVETMGLKLLQGRDFNLSKFPTDSSAVLINSSAAKIMGFEKDAVGKYMLDGTERLTIVGVIADYIQESPFRAVQPTVIKGATKWLNTMNIKLNPQLRTKEAISKTEAVFKAYDPNYPFEFRFLDEAYARKFDAAERSGNLVTAFACLAIFISCLGLFGLTAYMAECRTKEIGIRKVLGASLFSISSMLSKEFVFLAGLSCLIAFPVGYWLADHYISAYAYRIVIGWDIFLFAAVITLTITICTVGYQSVKAAVANPVDSLREN